MQNELRDLIEKYIKKNRSEEQGIFNWKNVAAIKEAFFGGKKENDVKLWYLLMFQMWHARWMEK